MVYNFFFDKKSADSYIKNMLNKKLAEELHKPVIRKFKNRKVHSSFKDSIWHTDLADMELLSKFSKEICFLLCVFNIFSKYTWINPLKDKKGITITNIKCKYANDNTITFFDSFGAEHFPKKIKKFVNGSTMIINIFRIQSYDSVTCGHFCVGFIDFILKGKSLIDFTNLFSTNRFKDNDKRMLKYIKNG